MDNVITTQIARLIQAEELLRTSREAVLELLDCATLSAEQREHLESAEQSLDDVWVPGIIEELSAARFDGNLSTPFAELWGHSA